MAKFENTLSCRKLKEKKVQRFCLDASFAGAKIMTFEQEQLLTFLSFLGRANLFYCVSSHDCVS